MQLFGDPLDPRTPLPAVLEAALNHRCVVHGSRHMAVPSRLQRCVDEVVAWINEHKRLPVRVAQRAKKLGDAAVTAQEKKETNLAYALQKLQKKSRTGELPASAANQLEQVKAPLSVSGLRVRLANTSILIRSRWYCVKQNFRSL